MTLPELGFTGRRVAEVLGITEEYVSMLRARTRREGSAGLMRRRGRPSALRAGDLSRARSWRAAGQTDAAIGDRLGVHATTVARALAGVERPGSAGGAEQTILAVPVLTEPVLTEPVLTAGGPVHRPVHRLGSGRDRCRALSLRRGDAALPLTCLFHATVRDTASKCTEVPVL